MLLWTLEYLRSFELVFQDSRVEGTPTLCDSMDGTTEHYAKWNKAGSERQIPYDLPYKGNLMNTTKNQAKYNQKQWSKEETDSIHKGGRWG